MQFFSFCLLIDNAYQGGNNNPYIQEIAFEEMDGPGSRVKGFVAYAMLINKSPVELLLGE